MDVNPNPAHEALVSLESYLDEFLLITQNVDDLHSRAGSGKLIHMHGELRKLRCEMCGEIIDAMDDEHLQDQYVKCVQCKNERLRPHIVCSHEMPLRMDEIYDAVGNVMSSSLSEPVDMHIPYRIVVYRQRYRCPLLGTNLDPPENVILFDEFHQGLAGELVPALVTKWMSE